MSEEKYIQITDEWRMQVTAMNFTIEQLITRDPKKIKEGSPLQAWKQIGGYYQSLKQILSVLNHHRIVDMMLGFTEVVESERKMRELIDNSYDVILTGGERVVWNEKTIRTVEKYERIEFGTKGKKKLRKISVEVVEDNKKVKEFTPIESMSCVSKVPKSTPQPKRELRTISEDKKREGDKQRADFEEAQRKATPTDLAKVDTDGLF